MTVQGQLTRAVAEALKHAKVQPGDGAAVALAKRYAVMLDACADDPEVLNDLGPKLLAALTALGMTPAGRGAKGGTGNAAPVASALDELRQRRARRGAG